MEKYGSNQNFSIVSISCSNENLGIEVNTIQHKGVNFSLIPYLVLNGKDKFATTILSAQFFNKDKTPLSNKLVVRVNFKFNDKLPIVKDENGNIKMDNYEDLVSIFDTAIGVFRGILFEWLKNSKLQRPFPLVDMERFIKCVNVSFSE